MAQVIDDREIPLLVMVFKLPRHIPSLVSKLSTELLLNCLPSELFDQQVCKGIPVPSVLVDGWGQAEYINLDTHWKNWCSRSFGLNSPGSSTMAAGFILCSIKC